MNTFDSKYMALKEEKLLKILSKEKKVSEVARELEVSRQSVHKWLLRYKRFGISGLLPKKRKGCRKAYNRSPKELEDTVIALARQYFRDGVETLSDRLAFEYNITLHPTTIYRILKRREIRYTDYYPHTKKNWKKKLYAHQVPGQELQMDTKYPFGYKQGRVIYTAIDDASRWVFAFGYEKANQENTLDFLKKLQLKAPFLIQKIRTDQGREFVGLVVREHLTKQGIIHRLNTPYCPEENGKIERFHRTLNEKCLRYGFGPRKPLEDLQYRLQLFLHYYNFQKRHRGLGMDGLTPIQKLQEKASVNLTLQCYIY